MKIDILANYPSLYSCFVSPIKQLSLIGNIKLVLINILRSRGIFLTSSICLNYSLYRLLQMTYLLWKVSFPLEVVEEAFACSYYLDLNLISDYLKLMIET